MIVIMENIYGLYTTQLLAHKVVVNDDSTPCWLRYMKYML